MRQFASYEEENIHYWTNRASGYSGVNQEELATDQKRVWGYTISRKIAARFPGRAPESLRILDVGTGFFAIVLAGMGYQVTAVDYTASMLAEARRNAGALADKIRFRQMNAEELSFADHSFDVVVTRNVTWNLPNPAKAYSHWTRVLAPGGLLLNFDAAICGTRKQSRLTARIGRFCLPPMSGTRLPERMWMPWRQLPEKPLFPWCVVPVGICPFFEIWESRPAPMRKSGGRSGPGRSGSTTPPRRCS